MQYHHPNRAAEGKLGTRIVHAGGAFDDIEKLATKRACKVFGFEHANLQPHSGTAAVHASQIALCNPGDCILSLDLQHGGHLSHGLKDNLSGRIFDVKHYRLNSMETDLDYANLEALAKKHKPKMIIFGSSSFPRLVDFERLEELSLSAGAYLLLDLSQLAGFVAAGLLSVPSGENVIVAMSTEKTLCGPRGGGILCSDKISARIDAGVFPGLQSSFSLASIAGKAAVLHDVSTNEFRALQDSILENAQTKTRAMASAGLRVFTEGTDTHLCILDLRLSPQKCMAVEKELRSLGILCNTISLPVRSMDSPRKNGLRFGTTSISICGYGESLISELVSIISETIFLGKATKEMRNRYSCLMERAANAIVNPLFL
jgi:glycine hydroxymethyltransferase